MRAQKVTMTGRDRGDGGYRGSHRAGRPATNLGGLGHRRPGTTYLRRKTLICPGDVHHRTRIPGTLTYTPVTIVELAPAPGDHPVRSGDAGGYRRRVTVSQLLCFLALAEHGSMGRAAASLGIAQPSLAQAITALEHEAGALLVHRVHRGAVLTPAGEAYTVHARRLLRLMTSSGAPGSGPVTGSLDIAADPVLAVEPGAPLLGAFRQAYPAVRLRVEVPERGADVAAQVLDARAELGLLYLPVPAGVQVTVLGGHDLMAAFPPGTPDVPDPVPVGELDGRDVIDVPGSSWRGNIVGRTLAAAGVTMRVVVETSHREAVVPLVLAGAGLAFLPETTASWAAAGGAVVRRLDPPLRNTYGLAYGPGELSAAAQAFQLFAGAHRSAAAAG
jgi:DNA-binding transcriptional LysR family regulator